MRVPFNDLQHQFLTVLQKLGFKEHKAQLISKIFAENSRDGVYSHGINRFPVFVDLVQKELIDIDAEPEMFNGYGVIENWDGHYGPGMYIASLAMDKAVSIAKEHGIGAVTVKNSSHWMRGGTYGWQAADAGCIGICVSNTIANMPPWGAKTPKLGNNPLIISVPRTNGHIVLDMALSQFSYGKLQEYELNDKELPVVGGYDENGNLSTNAQQIKTTQRTLPIGFWKGSGLSFILDVLVASLSGGQSVGQITEKEYEVGLSQFFLCIDASGLNESILEEIIRYTKEAQPIDENGKVYYPGERTMAIRKENEANGIPVNENIWQQLLSL